MIEGNGEWNSGCKDGEWGMGNVGASRYANLFISQITLIDSPS